MSFPVADLAAYFSGQWGLRREITDQEGVEVGTFIGSAEFRTQPSLLLYHEEGVLRWGTHRGPAYRNLRYRLLGPGQAEVYFDDDGFFHDLDLRAGSWHARHPCRDDLYDGEYTVLGPDRWHQRWVVAGPTKNHTLSTVFDRLA